MSCSRTALRGLLASLLSGVVGAQSPPAFEPGELLQKAAHLIDENTKTLPRFACAESIRRSLYVLPQQLKAWSIQDASPNDLPGLEAERRLALSNRVRLDVGVFEGRQLFAWPGAKEFKYEGFDELAGGGAASSGEFGPFTASVFLSDADPGSIRFIGLAADSGTRVATYNYEVPVESSHFSVSTRDGATATVAYRGVFQVDAQTGDLKRLIVQIIRTPSATGVLSGRITTDYARKKVGETEALLPNRSTMHLLFSDSGSLAVNETNYGSCRVFGAESTLDFGLTSEHSVSETPADEKQGSAQLPAGLKLISKLTTPVDVRESYAGDLVEAEVAEPVRTDGKTVIPKGALLTGRVVQLERRFYPAKEATIRIQFEKISFEGTSMPVSLGAAGPANSAFRTQPVDTSSGVAHVATIMHVGTDNLRLDLHTPWIFITK